MPVKPSRKRPPKPRTEPLRRGKACLNCRQVPASQDLLKKCDGVRPVCGPCTRVPKDDECEYTDVSSRTKDLQETISRLKARVNELENPLQTQSSSGSSRYEVASPTPSSPSIISGTSGSFSDSDHSLLGVQEPPVDMIPMLLDSFLPHASQYSFFMHPGRFRASALLQLPLGHPNRPSPALLCAVYLWGIHLSRSEPLVSYETIFIRRAQQHIATELSDKAHPVHRIHTIQAHVLLSTYFLGSKQFLEAEFHINAAVTLSLGYHLHMIRSSRPGSSDPPLLSAPGSAEIFLEPPRDAIEEGERIRGFWTVVYAQHCLIMTLRACSSNSSNTFGVLESPGLHIDTPWPLDIAQYERGMLPRDLRGVDTVQGFVVRGVPGPNSVVSAQVQAMVLLQRATQLAGKWSRSMSPQAQAAYTNAHAGLEARIQQFAAGIPSVSHYYGSRGEEARMMAVTHALLSAAIIQLHRPQCGADASGTGEAVAACVVAARRILSTLGDTNVPNFGCASPVVGTLLLLACQAIAHRVERMRYFQECLGSTLNVDVARNSEEAALLVDLQTGLTTMNLLAVDCPLVQYQLEKIQSKFNALGL
ncbi:hypothetical protein FB45DRAFT_1008827 [Roridomyces roridus]|uniref:Xylanolytic transcriptional activator regulatory domain-containing protein n=1 Tax=Roridomyces roridus TaxID=1738132 RepID=A0AAD7FBH3_9AGAR|nr:hypothetical protein FB45DRAFT_1008827 [Roridomyces roridus]